MKLENDPLAAFWMPFTSNRAYKAAPRMLAAAKDMHYTSSDGRTILDGTAGLWCVNAGHCRAPIVEAIRKAASELDFGPTFQLAHPLAFEFSSRIAALMPEGLDRIFFTNSGSESVDTALKIRMWFHPYGTWATMAAMIGVLALMALSPGRQIELWASVLVTAGFGMGWWITRRRAIS